MEDILPFAQRVAMKASCRLEVYDNMIHVFPMFSLVRYGVPYSRLRLLCSDSEGGEVGN